MVGGSAAGQFTALQLARAGHEVVLLDRDPVEPASGIEAAASGFRPAVPHFVQPHIVLPRCRLLLRQVQPDVYDSLLAAGAGAGAATLPFDAIVFRAFWRVMGMLARPGDVYTDPGIVARTQGVLRSLGAAPAMTQPTHAQLEAALA